MNSKIATSLFAFNRKLPAPFDTLPSARVDVVSQYSSSKQSTLSPSMIKAITAYCRYRLGEPGAVGMASKNGIAEYKSATGTDVYHIVAHHPGDGSIVAGIFNTSLDTIEPYELGESKRDGSAILLGMLPALIEDEEFSGELEKFITLHLSSPSDALALRDSMAVLCDNAYRRIVDDKCPAHIKCNIASTGNISKISRTKLDANTFEPTKIIAGEFVIFTSAGTAAVMTSSSIPHRELEGKYALTPTRVMSAMEKDLVPSIPDWYEIPYEVLFLPCLQRLRHLGLMKMIRAALADRLAGNFIGKVDKGRCNLFSGLFHGK